jgi:hypothetical protein
MISHDGDSLRLDMSGGRTTMDKVTQSLLKEFSEEHGIIDLPESRRFEHFTAYLMVRQSLAETFDTHDLVIGEDPPAEITGTDTGIDAIAVSVNDKLISDRDELVDLADEAGTLDVEFIFVQAETSSGFDGGKIGTFGFGVIDFFRDVPQMNRNANVSRAADLMQAIYERSSKFKKGNPRCKMYYATTGKVLADSTLEARMAGPKSDLQSLNQFGSVEFHRIGADTLQTLYQRTRSAVSAEIVFTNKVTIGEQIEGVDQAYSGHIPWSEFNKIISNESGVLRPGLFVSNVRDFQDYNGVNSEIRDTLRSAVMNRFILMNNGVTIIARKIRPTGNKFVLDDYQIVNGCQTSNVLYDNRDVLNDSVLIPIRLIGTEDEVVTNAIIRATNRQTEVKEEQFFALEAYAKKLEDFFMSYPVPSRVYYERRSQQYEKLPIEKTRVIAHQNLVKSFAGMFLNEPHRTTRNYAGLKKKVGTEIFHKDHKMETYYVAALAWYKLEYFFRSGKLEAKFKPARFHILMAARLLSVGDEMPGMNSNKMEKFANHLTNVLQSAEKSEVLIMSAALIVEKAAAGDFNRDNIRTEPFTEKVVALSKEARGKIVGVEVYDAKNG